MPDIEICQFQGEGYMPVLSSDGWRVAVVNSCERLLESNIARIERHFETDEVFVLLRGEATLFIGEERKRYSMESGKVYNVKRGVWHCLALKPDSGLLVIENDNTSDNNTERVYFK